MEFSKNVVDFMTVYVCIFVENNADEGSKLLFATGL